VSQKQIADRMREAMHRNGGRGARQYRADYRQLSLFPGQDEQDILLTRAEAAAYLRRSVPTLEAWARDGTGPKVVRMGPRGIRYRLADLRAFIEESSTKRAVTE
jgi:predicted DNA-binding transcriptional regulator AlpA